jgi:hypothetical protein
VRSVKTHTMSANPLVKKNILPALTHKKKSSQHARNHVSKHYQKEENKELAYPNATKITVQTEELNVPTTSVELPVPKNTGNAEIKLKKPTALALETVNILL